MSLGSESNRKMVCGILVNKLNISINSNSALRDGDSQPQESSHRQSLMSWELSDTADTGWEGFHSVTILAASSLKISLMRTVQACDLCYALLHNGDGTCQVLLAEPSPTRIYWESTNSVNASLLIIRHYSKVSVLFKDPLDQYGLGKTEISPPQTYI